MACSFIELSIGEKVDFGEILYADGHYVRAFVMQSHADYGIKVSFQRLDELDINIQSSNDNLPDGKDALDPVRDNYVDDFNHINQVSEIFLAPRERLRLFISLRMPDAKDEKRQQDTQSKRTHKFRNYTGSIKVTCSSASEGMTLHSSAIVVTARVCKSVLMIENSDVLFNDCVPGRTFYKDIDVWNMSEAVARFQIRWAPTPPHVRNAAAELQVYSLDTGTGEIRGEHELQGMQRKMFQLKFSPMRVGHSQGRLELVNVASPLSPASIIVSTFTTSARTAESDVLVLTSEIDFGTCVTGSSSLRPLKFKNNSVDRISVLLSSDRPKEITFLLEASDDATSTLPKPDLAVSSSDVVGPVGSASAPKSLAPIAEDSSVSAGTESRKKDRRVEEVILQPGQEKSLFVSFCPAVDTSIPPGVQQRLQNCDFRISFKVSRTGERDSEGESRMESLRPVRCRASICTSIISVYPSAINMGECLVAMTKMTPVRVTNMSDVPARICMSLKSKHLSILGSVDPVTIPVGGSHEFTLQLQPTTANPDYRKLIWVSNMLNPHNDVTIQVSSSNVDRNRVALHSILYTVSASELFVGKTTSSSKMLRSISFRNITAAPIRVALRPEISGTITIHVPKQFIHAGSTDEPSATADTVVHPDASVRVNEKSTGNRHFGAISSIFAVNERQRRASAPATSQNDEQQLARLQSQLDLATPPSRLGREKKDSTSSKTFRDSPVKRAIRRRNSTMVQIGPVALNEKVAPLSAIPDEKAFTPMRSEMDGIQNAIGSELDLERMLAIYGNFHPSIDPPFFKSCEHERRFVLEKAALLRSCESLLASSCAEVDDVVLPPGVDVPIILGISAENCGVELGGKLVAVEMAVLVQLVEFDKDLLKRAQEESETLDHGLDILPQRRIPVHIQQVCVSSMDVSQTHLNFGLIETGSDPKYLKLNLSNCAEVPLLYQIQMSGRFASGSISFRNHGDVGVVRPFWTKVIEVCVDPKIRGAFSETMVLQNVLNPSDTIPVTVKAEVKLRETFSLNASDSIDFGSVILDSLSNEASITVTNLTSAPRMFTLRQLQQNSTGVDSDSSLFNVHFTVQLGKQIGALRQKLTIEEKIEKLEHKLRIAQRKKKISRVDKIKSQIEAYRLELEGNIPKKILAASNSAQETDTPPSSDLSDADSMSGSDSESDSESSLSVAKKKSVPHFSKEKPYTFEIEGRCSRNVHIRICGTRLGFGSSSTKLLDAFEEFVQGTIVIHETKNSEVDRRINYSAVLVHAPRSFEDAAFPFNPNQPIASSGNRSSVLIVEQSPGQESKGACVGRQVSASFSLRNPTAHTCRIRLSLRSANVLSGEIKNVKCNGSSVPWQGEVNPMGRRELALTVEPQREGRLDVVFTVQDLTNGGSLNLTWIIQAKTQLHMGRVQPILFPGNTNLIVDFGDCYIDPSPNPNAISGIPMKKQKLEIRSLEHRVQVVSIKSNLITQVAFFKDEALKENAESFILRAHETIACYVALAQPSHPFAYGEASSRGKTTKSNLAKQLMDEYKTGRCRVLNGGITVTTRFADDAHGQVDSGLKHEVSLKLTANIGMSIMKIVHPADSLCFTPAIPYFDSVHRFQEHILSVLNETESLPMRYSITNPHKSDGITVSKPTNDLAPKKSYVHTLKVEQRLGGISISVIEVSNSSSRQIEFVRIISISISNPPALEFHDLPFSAAVAPGSPGGYGLKRTYTSKLLKIPPFYARTEIVGSFLESAIASTLQDIDSCTAECESLVLADSPQGLIVVSAIKATSSSNRAADMATSEVLSLSAPLSFIPGDIILKIDSVVVRCVSQAKTVLHLKAPNPSSTTQLLVLRDFKPMKLFFSRQKFAAALEAFDSSDGSSVALPSFDLLWLKLMWKHAPHSIVTLHLKERYAIEERLVVVSKLPIIVSNCSQADNSQSLDSLVSSLSDGLPFIDQLSNSQDMFSAVGLRCNCRYPIVIPPYAAEIQLRITPMTPLFSASQFEGLLLFLRPESLNRSHLKVHASIAGVLYAKGSFVDSTVPISPDRIDVGRIGFTNGWLDAPFQFTLGSASTVVDALVAIPRQLWSVTEACVLHRTGISPRPMELDYWNIMCAYKGQIEKLLLGTNLDDWFIIDVPAEQSIDIKGHVRPSVYKEEGCMGRVNYRVPLFEVFTNTVSELHVHAHIVDVPWVTQRLDQSTGALKVPPLSIPVAPDAGPCDCWFVLKNQRDATVTINFRIAVLPHFSELVVVSLLLRSNDTLCESVILQPGASVEMRLRLRAAKKTLPHNKWPKAALMTTASKLCEIEMSSSEYSETIPVHGQLICAPTLSVMDTEVSLSFIRDDRSSRHVRAREKLVVRCMREDDASFRISLESRSASMEQLLQRIVLQPESGLVRSGDLCEVWLEISAHRNLFQDLEDRISSIGTIIITDPDSSETCLRVDLRCMLSDELLSDDEPDDASAGLGGGSSRVTEIDSHSVSEAGAADLDDISSFAPDGRDERDDANCLLKLRNCTEIEQNFRYQVNVGQAEMGSESQKWKLFLESSSADPVSWEIVQAGPTSNSSWMRISKTMGTLKNAEDSDSITLTLLANIIGAYSTYLCIVNRNNPSDIKTVKVVAEVVSPKPARDIPQSQNLFRIDIDGLAEPSIFGASSSIQRFVHIGDVCYGQRLDAKSFHIVNLSSSLTLEFVLSHSTVHDNCDILFALAETSSEMVRTVFVKPSGSLRVFAFLRLRPPPGDSAAPASNLRIVAEIKCRLIRDHVEEIVFTGRARSPQFVLTPPVPLKIGFNVRSQSVANAQSERLSAPHSIELEPPWSSAISLPHDASVLLYNPSKIFKVQLLKKLSPDLTVESLDDALDVQQLGQWISCFRVGESSPLADEKAAAAAPDRGLASIFISVLPSVADIIQPDTWKLLTQQRYIEETAFLYNASDLTEYHVLRIGLSLRDDQTVIPSARNSLAINSLEARVANVLREFSCTASEYSLKLASTVPTGANGGPVSAPLAQGAAALSGVAAYDDDRVASIHMPNASAHAMQVHCLVDELMVLSKKGLHGGIARELAVLLFCGLFSHELAPCFADASKLKFYPLWLCSHVRQLEWFISAFAEGVVDENLDMLRSIFNRTIGRVRPEVFFRQQAQFTDVIFNRSVSSALPKSAMDEKDSARFYPPASTAAVAAAASSEKTPSSVRAEDN